MSALAWSWTSSYYSNYAGTALTYSAGLEHIWDILKGQDLDELRLTWLPKDAVLPLLPRYKKQYRRTFRGRLFPPGGPKK